MVNLKDGYVISGATNPINVNGNYIKDGTHNDKSAFTNGSYWLWYDGAGWVISEEKDCHYTDRLFFRNVLENEEDGKYGIVLPFDNTLLWQRVLHTTSMTPANASIYAANLELGGYEWHLTEDTELIGNGATPQEGSLLWWMNEERGFLQGSVESNRYYNEWLNDGWGFVGVTSNIHWTNTYSDPPNNESAWYLNTNSGSVGDVIASLNFRFICVSRNNSGWEVDISGEYFNFQGDGDVSIGDILPEITFSVTNISEWTYNLTAEVNYPYPLLETGFIYVVNRAPQRTDTRNVVIHPSPFSIEADLGNLDSGTYVVSCVAYVILDDNSMYMSEVISVPVIKDDSIENIYLHEPVFKINIGDSGVFTTVLNTLDPDPEDENIVSDASLTRVATSAISSFLIRVDNSNGDNLDRFRAGQFVDFYFDYADKRLQMNFHDSLVFYFDDVNGEIVNRVIK